MWKYILGLVALAGMYYLVVMSDQFKNDCTGDCNQGRNCNCKNKNEE